MTLINIIGGSEELRAKTVDPQRTINFIPFASRNGKIGLLGTPGLSIFASCGNNPCRGGFVSSTNGRCFFLNGNTLYEVKSNGDTTAVGSISLGGEDFVSFSENETHLAICNGSLLYALEYSTNSFSEITVPFSISFISNCDNFFVGLEKESGRFYVSAFDDITSWDALDFATAEGSPDALVAASSALGQLWLFGKKTIEVYHNTGSPVFPFARVSGGSIMVGTESPFSIVPMDNSLFFVGKSEHGGYSVYRVSGFSPKKLSNEYVDRSIESVSDKTKLVAWAYQEEGRLYYALTGSDLQTTLVYDVGSQIWHERTFFDEFSGHTQHIANVCVNAFGKNLVGSRLDGKIYEMSLDYISDNGNKIIRERITESFSFEGRNARLHSLELELESGMGQPDWGSYEPKVMLSISYDRGKTWGQEILAEIGKSGEYNRRAIFRRLGVATEVAFKISVSDMLARTVINEAYLRAG